MTSGASTAPFRVGHVMTSWLPISQTFVRTQIASLAPLLDDQRVFPRKLEGAPSLPSIGEDVRPLDWQVRPGSIDRWLHRGERFCLPGPTRFEAAVAHAARSSGVNVLHGHFGSGGHAALVAARRLRLPLVTAFHGNDVYGARPTAFLRLFREGTLFTCVGPAAGEELMRRGCPPERLHVVPVGVALEDFDFAPTDAPGSAPVFLQVGRLVTKKGVDLSIRALGRLRDEWPDARLVIVGDGPERPALERLAAEAGVQSQVRFLGARPHDEVRRLIRQAHIGLQPSRCAENGDREGTPTVIIEFQAAGLDLIASDHADIPSIVPDPDQLVSEGAVDALAARMRERLAEAPDARLRRLVAAREHVEQRHDARRIARTLTELYRTATETVAARLV